MTDKFLFLADFHVKARTWTNNTQVRGDAYVCMQQIGDFAEENDLDTLVIGGDFFDSNRPTPDDLVQTVDFLSRFKQVYYIRGNHDSCDPSYLESVSRILGAKNFVTQLNGQFVHLGNDSYLTGISWMPSKEEYRLAVQQTLDYFRKNYPERTLYLVLHTSFKHLLTFEGAYTFDTSEVAKWCKDMDVVLLVGDVHVRDTRRVAVFPPPADTKGVLPNLGELTFHSPGAVYPLQFNETDFAKAITIVNTAEDDYNRRLRPQPVEVRKYASFHYTGTGDSLKDFLENFNNGYHVDYPDYLPAYIRVVLDTGVEPPHIIPSDYPNLVIQIQLEADAFDPGHAIDSPDGSYTLEQAINDEFPDPDVAEIANQLVKSPDPAGDLQKYLELWQVERTTM